MPRRFEDLAKLVVVLAEARTDVEFELVETLPQLLKGTDGTPQLDERP